MRDHLNEALDRAELDPLTGVGNRVRLHRHGQRLVSERRPFTVLYLDLNRFQQLNDRYVHRVGDQDRKRVVSGKSVYVRVALGGRRIFKNKSNTIHVTYTTNFSLTLL